MLEGVLGGCLLRVWCFRAFWDVSREAQGNRGVDSDGFLRRSGCFKVVWKGFRIRSKFKGVSGGVSPLECGWLTRHKNAS